MRFCIALFAVMAVLLTGCTKKADWHQKMVLYFDTPEGPMTASSVIRVDFTGAIEWLGSMDGNHTDLTGEAVVADLGGRYLFALIEENAGPMIWLAMRREFDDVAGFKASIGRIIRQAEPLDVPQDLWPRMVTFEDIEDPASVQIVNTGSFDETFGQSYSLQKVTIHATREPLTLGGVEQILAWWCGYTKPYRRLSGKSGPITDNHLANRLGPGAFKIGECK